MAWNGRASYTGEGKLVNLGHTVVPSRATYSFDGDQGSPDSVVRFEVRDGRPECVEIIIKARPNGRGIRAEDVGLINIGPLAESVFAELGSPIEPIPGAPGMASTQWPASESGKWAVRGDVADRRSQKRRGPNRDELERVAEVYRSHLESAPVQAVAQLFDYSDRTAARRIQEARAAGLLPPTTKGKKKA